MYLEAPRYNEVRVRVGSVRGALRDGPLYKHRRAPTKAVTDLLDPCLVLLPAENQPNTGLTSP